MGADDFDFGYLEPRGTVRFTLEHVKNYSAKDAVLELEYAGPGTPARAAYDSARIKGAPDEQVLRAIAPAVVKGWEHVNGKDGQPLPCTTDRVRAMVDGLIKVKRADILWSAMLHALNPNNFRDAAPAAESLGKE